MADMQWLDEIERNLKRGEYCNAEVDQVITAVRLSERVVDEEIRGCRTVCSFERLNDLRSRLRSGKVEAKQCCADCGGLTEKYRGVGDGKYYCETCWDNFGKKSAPSEDEGKNLRDLWERLMDEEVAHAPTSWGQFRVFNACLLRFYAECTAPYEKLVEAARETVNTVAGGSAWQKLCEAVRAFPDPTSQIEPSAIPAQPPPLTGKPHVSDEEIADEIREAAMRLLDGLLHSDEWLAAARRVRVKIEGKS